MHSIRPLTQPITLDLNFEHKEKSCTYTISFNENSFKKYK